MFAQRKSATFLVLSSFYILQSSLVVMFVFISILPRIHKNNLQNVILIYLTPFLFFQCELNSQLHISIVFVSVHGRADQFSFSGCLYCCHCAAHKITLLHGALYYQQAKKISKLNMKFGDCTSFEWRFFGRWMVTYPLRLLSQSSIIYFNIEQTVIF